MLILALSVSPIVKAMNRTLAASAISSFSIFIPLISALLAVGVTSSIFYYLYLAKKYDAAFGDRYHRNHKDCPSGIGFLSPRVKGLSKEKFFSISIQLIRMSPVKYAAKLWKNKISDYEKKTKKKWSCCCNSIEQNTF